MPPEEMVNFYVPQFSGILDHYWGRNAVHLHSEYLGVAVIILAIMALTRAWPAAQRRMVWLWSGVFVVALLWALGGFTPFYRLVYAIVPGTKFFRAPSTMLYVVSFSVAVLAAFGAERAVRRQVTRRYLIVWGVVAALVAALGASGGLTNLAVAVADPSRTDFALANDGAIRLGALRATLFAALTLTCLFLLGSGRLSRNAGAMLLAGIVAVDLWSVERLYWRFSPRAEQLYAGGEVVDYLKRQTQPGRVLPFLSNPQTGRDPFLTGDALMAHGLRSVLGYHGNELGRYQQLGGPGYQNVVHPNFWALMNVRFVLTEAEDLGVASLTRVVGPSRNGAGHDLFLYKVAEEHPAAWLVPVIVKAPDDAVLGTLLNPQFDVRRAALFDTSAAVTARTVDALPAPLAIAAKVTRFEPGAIDVELDQPAPAGSALMVSENFYPGWHATVDSAPARVGRADMTIIGVEMPGGGKNVSLRFSSRPYETGRLITLFALVLGLVSWVAGALLDRRRGD
jgi:hypothetical protein